MESGKVIAFDGQFIFELIFQIANPLVLFFILGKLLFNPVREFMEKRSQKISSKIEDANALEVKAQSLHKQYEQKLEDINKEADEILSETRKKARDMEEKILANAKEEAEKIKQRAMTDMERERERVKEEVKKEMIDISSLMASNIVKTSIDEASQKKMLDDIINDLGDVKWLS